MDVVLDQLEYLWPSYRGAVLLGSARESQGRVSNVGIAVTAGHVSLSLEVHPASIPSTASQQTATTAGSSTTSRGNHKSGDDDKPISPAPPPSPPPAENDGTRSQPASLRAVTRASLLRLTVLLDAVPASAPKPGTQQMARFLTKVLGRNALEEDAFGGACGARGARDARGGGLARREVGLLGADVPEMLVVEHADEVRRIRKIENRAGRKALVCVRVGSQTSSLLLLLLRLLSIVHIRHTS